MDKLQKIISSFVFGASALLPPGCNSLPTPMPRPELVLEKTLLKHEGEGMRVVAEIDKTLVKHNDPGKTDLGVFVEQSYIDSCKARQQDWWEQIKFNIQTHSGKRFREEFGIELDIDGVSYLVLNKNTNDPEYLFCQFVLEHDPGQFDALVAFVARPPEGILGVASGNGHHAMVFSAPLEHLTTQHEISHLYNAIDIYLYDPNWWNDAEEGILHPMWEHPTIMTYRQPKTDEWNAANKKRIKNAKPRSWKFDSKTVDEVRSYLNQFEKDKQKEVFDLICHADANTYTEEAGYLALSLCLEFPKDWRLKYYHSQILEKKERTIPSAISERVKLYRDIIKLNPPAWVYNNIAWNIGIENNTLLYLGLDCLALAKKSVEMEAKDYNLDTLGYIYYKMERYDKAAELLEKACEETKSLDIATHLARLYYRTGDLRKFEHAVSKMLAIEPEEGMIHYNYARALMDRFVNQLTKGEKLEVLDSAINGYNIYPCSIFQELVREAYAFNSEHWNSEEFKKKYEPFIVKIIGGNKFEEDNLHFKIIWR